MARSSSKSGSSNTISRSIYVSPELDGELSRFAQANDVDFSKACRVLIQRGMTAPVLPDFAIATLSQLAAAKKLTLDAFLVEILTRYAIEHAPPSK